MGKLYLFGIGGTGARIIKSFAMLCASGVQLNNCSTVIPIIIDPDTSNGDLLATVDLLKQYRKIRSKISPLDEGFFKTEIATLASLATENAAITINDSFDFKLGDTVNRSFLDFVDLYALDYENQLLLKLLYSEKNFQDTLTKGFLGNPNVGSIVLNKLKDSEEFKFFGSTFNNGDRIFIISSIFGGTGAAGFPLLLKTFRNAQFEAGAQAIQNAKIGGISVLPYFAVMSDEKSSIDSNNFITKSKAALSYYANNIKNINALYYIGDSEKKNYDNMEGGASQRNEAHITELIAAMSIFNFMRIEDNDLPDNTTKYFEYALNIKNIENPIEKFDDLGSPTKHIFGKNFVKFYLFAHFYKNYLNKSFENDWAKDLSINDTYLSSDFHGSLNSFLSAYFIPWLIEMSKNTRGFFPFKIDLDEDLTGFLNTKPIDIKHNPFKKKFENVDDFRKILNSITAKKGSTSRNIEFNCINTFWLATNKIFTDYLKHF